MEHVIHILSKGGNVGIDYFRSGESQLAVTLWSNFKVYTTGPLSMCIKEVWFNTQVILFLSEFSTFKLQQGVRPLPSS